MIILEDGELKLINILASRSQGAKAEFDGCMVAQASLIKLLEKKYKAIFNAETGQLEKRVKKGESNYG